ncbi:metallopeptidase [Candidatus Pacearchaeota archaeon]|nr:metallopeptidase [Candidatus Pacearchaeota archaeon]
MRYEHAEDLKEKTKEIIKKLEMNHIRVDDIACIRSFGSSSRAIARCHALGKVMQKALGRKGFYVLEFISEKFDNQSEEERTKTIIHELMHIPFTFGGGFKHHDYVTRKNVDKVYQEFLRRNQEFFPEV